MMLHPDGLYPHQLSTWSVFFGVLVQWLGLSVIFWVIVAFFARLMVRNTARRAFATFVLGQGRHRWN